MKIRMIKLIKMIKNQTVINRNILFSLTKILDDKRIIELFDINIIYIFLLIL